MSNYVKAFDKSNGTPSIAGLAELQRAAAEDVSDVISNEEISNGEDGETGGG